MNTIEIYKSYLKELIRKRDYFARKIADSQIKLADLQRSIVELEKALKDEGGAK